ncbi:dihydrolipoamide dehydrogenase [Fontimonas thermophila]|uniref:Dihydrolipoyl dehydrogenase n=2 Tax=Fontimonas thermophila TaxID=1076937 RepID=A0A1I2JTW7_9GAMM|nr:dihydrolipoyl dehydrogenase [Fontimonas thermophila]SFF57390.1 dihydrolipoamide dehydrogenase [Fontimonas thermophila]
MIDTRVLVVGGGPGGYVCAIRAGQLGLDTTLVESGRLGGTCLTRGCIPSKALIQAASRFDALTRHVGDGHMGISLAAAPRFDLAQAVRWKDGIVERLSHGVAGLLKKAKVRVVYGHACFSDAKTCTVTRSDAPPLRIRAEHVVLATGSVAAPLPHLPYGPDVLSSTEALALTELPRRLVVVGAGYIGLELGIAFAKLGVEVSFVEAQARILPGYDAALVRPVEQWLRTHGIAVHVNTRALGIERRADGLHLSVQTGADPARTIACDKVLVAVGRRPCTQGWGLEQMAIDMNGPFVKIDARCHTSMRNVWAIGDLVGEPMLAHKASAQGEMVAEAIAGHRRAFDPVAIPAVCFTEPEIVAVGLTPEQAKAQGIAVVTGQFPLAANGRALTMDAGADGGFVRVTARADNHLVLGIHAVGAHASELSGEFAHALEMGAVLEDLAHTIHVHPTLGETVPEAALAALGRAIHI